MYKKMVCSVKIKMLTNITLMNIVSLLTLLSIFSFEMGHTNPFSIGMSLMWPKFYRKEQNKIVLRQLMSNKRKMLML